MRGVTFLGRKWEMTVCCPVPLHGALDLGHILAPSPYTWGQRNHWPDTHGELSQAAGGIQTRSSALDTRVVPASLRSPPGQGLISRLRRAGGRGWGRHLQGSPPPAGRTHSAGTRVHPPGAPQWQYGGWQILSPWCEGSEPHQAAGVSSWVPPCWGCAAVQGLGQRKKKGSK